jgi:hypothetical protein
VGFGIVITGQAMIGLSTVLIHVLNQVNTSLDNCNAVLFVISTSTSVLLL